eukprot:505941-Pleurochrysis_carterae.AAC.1
MTSDLAQAMGPHVRKEGVGVGATRVGALGQACLATWQGLSTPQVRRRQPASASQEERKRHGVRYVGSTQPPHARAQGLASGASAAEEKAK